MSSVMAVVVMVMAVLVMPDSPALALAVPLVRERTVNCPKPSVSGAYSHSLDSDRKNAIVTAFEVENRNTVGFNQRPATLFWVNPKTGEEMFAAAFPPGSRQRIGTFTGHRFMLRDSENGRPLMDHTVGYKSVPIPESANCLASKLPFVRNVTNFGVFSSANVGLLVMNESPCDLVLSWAFPAGKPDGANGTRERWSADLQSFATVGPPTSHFENTYPGHLFNVRLANGQLVKSYHMEPLQTPICDSRRGRALSDLHVLGAAIEVQSRVLHNDTLSKSGEGGIAMDALPVTGAFFEGATTATWASVSNSSQFITRRKARKATATSAGTLSAAAANCTSGDLASRGFCNGAQLIPPKLTLPVFVEQSSHLE